MFNMRRTIAFAVAVAMSVSATPLFAARAGRAGQAQGTSLAGTATTSSGQTIPNATVQVRNLSTGQLVGTTTSSPSGEFRFVGLPAGNYVLEIVNAAGQI